jgi:uncharacterized protein (UPF0210 family)
MDIKQVTETIAMIEEQNFDVRTITMGISLLDCIDSDIDKAAEKVYNKIVSKAKNLVAVGDEIAAELGIPIVNKRVFCYSDFNYRCGDRCDRLCTVC